jgi:hypothetical protein
MAGYNGAIAEHAVNASQNNGTKVGGRGGAIGGNNNGPSGTNRDGLPYAPGQKPKLKTIPDVEDTPVVQPEPIDLAPLTVPARKPLRDVSIGGQYAQAGITGYAVFVPLLALMLFS